MQKFRIDSAEKAETQAVRLPRQRDPYEEEAERLARWLAEREAGYGVQAVSRLPEQHSTGVAANAHTQAELSAITGSLGEQLPKPLREQFEAKLGVDLSGVRLHTDPNANRFAGIRGMHAVAVNQHILLAKPNFDLNCVADRELIAHEVVHAVQQRGNSSLQLQPWFTRPKEEIQKQFEALLQKHIRDRGKVPNSLATELAAAQWLIKIRAAFEPDVDGKFPTPMTVQEVADTVYQKAITGKNEKDHWRQNAVGSVVADYFRMNHAYEYAAAIQLKIPYAKTLAPSLIVMSYIIEDHKALVKVTKQGMESAWASTGRGGLWQDDLVEKVDAALEIMPRGANEKTLRSAIEKIAAPVFPHQTMSDDDLFEMVGSGSIGLSVGENAVIAGKIIDAIYGEVRAGLLEILDRQATRGNSEFSNWGNLFESFEQATKNQATDKNINIGSIHQKSRAATDPILKKFHYGSWRYRKAITRSYQKKMLKRLANHRVFWDKVKRRVEVFRDADSTKSVLPESLENVDATLLPALDEFPIGLSGAFKTYAELPSVWQGGKKGIGEGERDFQKAFKDHPAKAEAFRKYLIETAQPPLNAVLDSKRGGNEDGAFHTALDVILLIEYFITDTRQITSEINDYAGIQQQAIKRRLIAERLKDIGQLVKASSHYKEPRSTSADEKKRKAAVGAWTRIEETAWKVLFNEFIQSSLLVLQNDFEPSKENDPRQMKKEFGAYAEISGLEPITFGQLSDFFAAMYDRTLKGHLRQLIGKANAMAADQRDIDDLWTADKAQKLTESDAGAGKIPKRYVSADPLWSRYKGDRRGAVGELVIIDPKYQEFIARRARETEDQKVIWPAEKFTNKEIVVWSFPDPHDLILPLVQVPLIRGMATVDVDLNGKEDAPVGNGLIETYTTIMKTRTKGLPNRPDPDEKDQRKAREELDRQRAGLTKSLFDELIEVLITEGRDVPPDHRYFKNVPRWHRIVRMRAKQLQEASTIDVFEHKSVEKRQKKEKKRLGRERREEFKDRNRALREATTVDRAVVAKYINEVLARFDEDPRRFRTLIGTALAAVAVFESAVEPATKKERRLQASALVLDVLPKLAAALDSRYPLSPDKDDGWYYLSRTRAHLDVLLGGATPEKETEGPTTESPIDADVKGILDRKDYDRKKIEDSIASVEKRLFDEMRTAQWDHALRGDAGQGAHGMFITHSFHNRDLPVHGPSEKQPMQLEEKDRAKQDFIQLPGGLAVRIKSMRSSFTFLPPQGDKLRASSKDKREHARYLPARVYIGSSPKEAEDVEPGPYATEPEFRDDGKKNPNDILLEIDVWAGKEVMSTFHVRANDFDSLRWVADIVTSESIVQSFENSAAVLKGFGEAGMFVASLIPIVGLAMTAVEAARFMAMLKYDKEFKDQLNALVNDPAQYIDELYQTMIDLFEPDALFDALLNGNFETPEFLEKVKGKKSRPMGGKRVAKVFTRMKRIGAVAAMKMESFQEGAQRPIRSAQKQMGEHPRVSALTNWAGDNVHRLSDFETLILRHPVAGPLYLAYLAYRKDPSSNAFGSFAQPLTELQQNITTGIEQMQSFTLPKNVLPLDMLLAGIVELMLVLVRKAGGRYGKIAAMLGRLLREGLDKSGLYQPMLKMVGELAEGSVADPNKYWREDIVPPLEPKLQATIASAGDGIQTALKDAPVIGDFFGNDRNAGKGKNIATVPLSLPKKGGSVTTSEADDGLFDDPRVKEAVPEGEAQAIPVTMIPYDVMKSLPDSFWKGMPEKVVKEDEPQDDWNVKKGSEASRDMKRDQDAKAAAQQASQENAGGKHATGEGVPRDASKHPLTPGTGESGAPNTLPVGRSSAGKPLGQGLKQTAERGFGHDLSHVRLHQDAQADVMTRSLCADALTSGSHVFMRSGLSPRSGHGASVFNHEVSHVLQKTGARPLGSKVSEPGRLPKQGPGLRHRADEERAADQMASQTRTNHRSSPIPVKGAHGEGFSPSVKSTTIETFLKKISSPGGSAGLEKTVRKAHRRKKVAHLDDTPRNIAWALWEIVERKIDGTERASEPFANKTALGLLKTHLNKRLAKLPEGKLAPTKDVPKATEVIDHLAARRQIEETKSGGQQGKKPKKAYKLDAKGFLNDLSLYITARSGIVIDLNHSLEELKTTPSSTTKISAKIKHVELYFVTNRTDAGKAIWDEAIKNTWQQYEKKTITDEEKASYRRSVNAVLGFNFRGDPPSSVHSDATGRKADDESRGVVGTGGFQPIWGKGEKLIFNEGFFKDVQQDRSTQGGNFKTAPRWEQYVGLKRGKPSKNSLRLALHKEATKPDEKLGPNARNSHHIVQFLLAEYFHNAHDTMKPFPGTKNQKVIPESGPHTKATSTGIKVEQTYGNSSSRGGPMPAAIISEVAHQKADLHVTAEPDDKTARPTQGAAIHRKFTDLFTDYTGVTTKTLDAAHAHLQDDANRGSDALYRAVRDTGRWLWRDQMHGALERNFPRFEAKFYLDQFRNPEEESYDGEGEEVLKTLHDGKAPEESEIESGIRDDFVPKAITYAMKVLGDKGWDL